MMMFHIIPGHITVKIVSADVTGLLTDICRHGIVLRDVNCTDMLTVRAVVAREDYSALKELVNRKGGEIRQQHKGGLFTCFSHMIRRPVVLLGVAFLLLLTVLLPTRVLFVQVQGNHTVPTNLILECAEAAGVRFGALRRSVRSESVKNTMLHSIPSLQWVGVNSVGCVAVILVEERAVSQMTEKSGSVSSIVAQRDGIITSCTATRGNMLCVPGQAVRKGEVLISGYTDVGLCIRATRAEGEVFATTEREVLLYMPSNYTSKGSKDSSVLKISILFGKKRINLCKGSGILGYICDRMYQEYYLTLPGGFCLPLGIAVEKTVNYLSAEVVSTERNVALDASAAAEAYLTEQMVSGQILHEMILSEQSNGVYMLSGHYICEEMIGTVKQEEILEHYGKNN